MMREAGFLAEDVLSNEMGIFPQSVDDKQLIVH
jgi:hypothetical protein